MKFSKFQKGYVGALLILFGIFWSIMWAAQYGVNIFNPLTYAGFILMAIGTLIILGAMEEGEGKK